MHNNVSHNCVGNIYPMCKHEAYVWYMCQTHICLCVYISNKLVSHTCVSHAWLSYMNIVHISGCASRIYLGYKSRAHKGKIYQYVCQTIWKSREKPVHHHEWVTEGNVYVVADPNIRRPKNLPARIVQVGRVTMGWYTIVPAPTDQSSDIHRPALTSFLSDCNIQPKWNLEIRQKILKNFKK